MDKAPDAFRTISEVADELDIPQHVLRFWETRFSQIKPMKRSGGRRYYRPDDVDLLRGIRRLLYGEGYTIRGVQRILKENGIKSVQGLGDGGALPVLMATDDVSPGRPGEQPTPDAAFDETAVADRTGDDVVDAKPAPRALMATPLPRDAIAPRTPPGPFPAPPGEPRPHPTVRVETQDGTEFAIRNAGLGQTDRARDVVRLKAVLHDLVACRHMLDRALQDG